MSIIASLVVTAMTFPLTERELNWPPKKPCIVSALLQAKESDTS